MARDKRRPAEEPKKKLQFECSQNKTVVYSADFSLLQSRGRRRNNACVRFSSIGSDEEV